MKRAIIILCLSIATMVMLFCRRRNSFDLTGPYLGQKPPGAIPELFAPGIVSTGFHEHSFPSFSPDGSEVLWTQTFSSNYIFQFPVAIISMKNKGGRWSDPEYAGFSLKPECGEAFFSPDGERIYFSSRNPAGAPDQKAGTFDIWYVEKTEDGWSTPRNLGPPINTTNHEFQPTVTMDGTLYYVGYYERGKNNYGIYRACLREGEYAESELLPDRINTESVDWTPFIAPDESYLLFSSLRPGGYGGGDLYISYRMGDGTWSEAVNLGPSINKGNNERYPYVSPDGKYLFYVTDKVNDRLLSEKDLTYREIIDLYQSPGNGWSDVYWVDASIIHELRPAE